MKTLFRVKLVLLALARGWSFEAIRINCGGGDFTDSQGKNWQADKYFNTGQAYGRVAALLDKTPDAELFRTMRFDLGFWGQNLRYDVPVTANRKYRVVLHFFETSRLFFALQSGQLRFAVFVEDSSTTGDLSMVEKKSSGPGFALLTESWVADETLTISFQRKSGCPMISAIEIFNVSPIEPPSNSPLNVPVTTPTLGPSLAPGLRPNPGPSAAPSSSPSQAPSVVPSTLPSQAPSPAPTAPVFEPILINAGGSAINLGDMQWMADKYFQGGRAFSKCSPAPKDIYCTERYFKDSEPKLYEIPVPPGNYNLTLHFQEIFYTQAGQRIFDVIVEDTMVYAGLDLIAVAGPNTPFTLTVNTAVVDEFLKVEFVAQTQNPKISGLEIRVHAEDGQESPVTAPVTAEPSLAPSNRPSSKPTSKPSSTPSLAPSKNPTAPTLPPVEDPIPAPVEAPVHTQVQPPTPELEPIRINCGGDTYFDIEGNTWVSDTDFVTGGGTWSTSAGNIVGTQDDELYFTERNGECQFDIHLPTGNYVIKLHFAEIYHNSPGKRVFDVVVGQTFFPGLDVVAFGGGVPKKAVTLEFVETIVSGTPLQIKLIDGPIDMPKILAIEIELNGPHLAHAVTGGPYFGVDIDGDGYAVVPVDGSQSHTHAENMNLISFVWKSGGQTLGTGVATSLMLPEGENTVMLTVVDNGGNESTDTTTITVQPEGYPTVSSISPNTGPIAGNTQVTITGAGFTDPSSQTTVHFGGVQLTGAALDIKNSSTIIVSSPPIGVGVPVLVSVATLTGESNSLSFTYVGDVAIEFSRQTLIGFTKPSAVAFGPDSKLYVANTDGKIGKFTLNETFDEVVDSVISSTLENGDAILGMAFDPMDTSANPTLYVSRSELFHGEWKSSFGKAINGKIWVVSGANLDTAVPVITGLPVSDHDHATNGLEFGDKGELYIQVGGNTNGGIPGGLTNGKQEENYFSAATLVAYMGNSTFDGTLLYDDNGNPVGGNGVQVFAAGFRNPYGITLHSNGHLYGTDNGPNLGYGDMSTGCSTQKASETHSDKLDLIEKGNYYGHPNRKRAEVDNDPRQCIWRHIDEPSDSEYTSPLMKMPWSSFDGITEFQSDHFAGQMRGDLIIAKYLDDLFRVILSPDGRSTDTPGDKPVRLTRDAAALDVTQAPNGNLIGAGYKENEVHVYKPIEPDSPVMTIKACYPRRGSVVGGSKLTIYGINFGSNPLVTVGGNMCTVLSSSTIKIECTLPGGTGTVDIVLSVGGTTATFANGYRYITGTP